MNEANCKRIKQWVMSHQDNLNVRLPDEQDLPYARNAWCHLFGCIADVYHVRGKGGYKVIPDSEFDNVMKILQIAYDYGEDPNVYDRFPKVDQSILQSITHDSSNNLTQYFQ